MRRCPKLKGFSLAVIQAKIKQEKKRISSLSPKRWMQSMRETKFFILAGGKIFNQ